MNTVQTPDLKPPADGGLNSPVEDRPGLAAWHAGWAVACALLALDARWTGTADGSVFYALLILCVPGLAGLGLLLRDGGGERMTLLSVWGLATLLASAFSGGLTGPLSGFVFMPLVAGLALNGQNRAQAGAAWVAVAAVCGLFSVWLNGQGPHAPSSSALSAVMTAVAASLALRLSWRHREALLATAKAEATRIESLLAAQPGLMLVLETSGKVVAAYGVPPASLPITSLFETGLITEVHSPDRSRLAAAMERAAQGHSASAVFAPRLALDRRIQILLRPLDPSQSGASVRLIAQIFDASVQHARELGLETARAEAETREIGKSRFLANMSHELRTPLNAIIGFSDIMRQSLFGPMPERYAVYVEHIHQAGCHLLDLINDVLDVSKIEAERYTLTLERFDAREVVSAAIALVRVNADDQGVSLSGVLPPEAVEVTADKRALKQIALNLLSNAIKFTPTGGSVTITAETIGPYLEIVVADTGLGIAPEDVQRLGRPFEQAGEMEQRRQGTGLGLSLVRAFTELHKGQMTIDSTVGEGTAVTVRMPVAVVVRPPGPEGGGEIVEPSKAGK